MVDAALDRAQYLAELRLQDQELEKLELIRARDSLAIYCGLHIPAEIESDEDLVGLEQVSQAARYIPAAHHRLLIEKLEAVERGEIKRLMVFMPPRAGKSIYCSTMFPAWNLGRHPQQHIIQGSYNDDLASRFGKMARRVFSSGIHNRVFGVGLAQSSKAAGNWETDQGGEYYAFGMNAGVTGRPANGAILDDLIRGRRDAESKTVRDNTWDTYEADVWTRLEPARDTRFPGWIVYIATRWHDDDPAGRILPPEAFGRSGWFKSKQGEQWYVLCLVAEVETLEEQENDPLGRVIGERLWPEWFTEERFEVARKNRRNWNSLYQQKPREDEGAILKRAWWQKWPANKALPKCGYVVSVYDTAMEEGEEDDCSARTTWGVFEYEEPAPIGPEQRQKWRKKPRMCAILLEAWEERVEFPELRRLAADHYFRNTLGGRGGRLAIDRVMVEKKVSGHGLIQELRRAGVPVMGLPAKESKLLRAHAAAVVFEDGCMFYPDTRWAELVVEKCAAATFMKGSPGNDTGDTVVHAANWLRKTYHLNTKGDAPDPDDEPEERRHDRPRLFG